MSRTLTRKGSATRQRIVEGAAVEFRERGVATTLDDVCRRTATSKSQLFHYFSEGKEQLLLAVARFEAERVLTDQQPSLGNLTSWQAWQEWRDVLVARYERQRQSQECPLGALVSQLGPNSAGAQAITAELLRQWQGEIAGGIKAMQECGEVAADLDVDKASGAMIAGIQGGVLLMFSTGRMSYLEAALDVGIAGLRQSATGATGDREGHAGRRSVSACQGAAGRG